MSATPEWWEELFDERYFLFYERLAQPVISVADADFIERALALAPGAAILDLGCGQGRHAVALAQKGYAVTGLDLSPFLLDQARALASAAQVDVKWVRRDMRATAGLGPFDACVSLHTSLGFFSDEEDERVLSGIRSVLRADGGLLLDLDNPFPLLREMPMDTWTESPLQVTRSVMTFDPLSSRRVVTRTRFPSTGGREKIPTSSVRLYMPHEVRGLLERCGLEPEGLFGALADEPYDWSNSLRMVWTARNAHGGGRPGRR